MQVEKYLEKYQPVIYKTFLRSFQNEHLSHAYLLVGNTGTPLLEVAKFLAKTILCDDPSPLACNNCITCLRVDDENYPDFIVFDGSKSTIKKDEVERLDSSSKTFTGFFAWKDMEMEKQQHLGNFRI